MSLLVVNTRPTDQAPELSELLVDAGFQVIEIPALEIEFVDCKEDILSALKSYAEGDIVAFTSQNAVKVIESCAEIVEQLTRMTVASVGGKTKIKLEQAGVRVSLVPLEAKAEKLADLIEEQGPRKILYLSGTPNAGSLTKRFGESIGFKEILTYRSSPDSNLEINLTENREKLAKSDFIVFMSSESMLAYTRAADEVDLAYYDKRCVVISDKMLEIAKFVGFSNVTVTYAPSIEAVVDSLKSLSSDG
jgi:uroporphyrinogen-III synthase